MGLRPNAFKKREIRAAVVSEFVQRFDDAFQIAMENTDGFGPIAKHKQRDLEFRPFLKEFPQHGDLLLQMFARAAPGGIPRDPDRFRRFLFRCRRSRSRQIADGEKGVAVRRSLQCAHLGRQFRQRNPEVFPRFGVVYRGLGHPLVFKGLEPQISKTANLRGDGPLRDFHSNGELAHGFPDGQRQMPGGIALFIGRQFGDVSKLDAPNSLRRERKNAGAIDVAGDLLHQAGVHAAADFGFERHPCLFLFHHHAIAQVSVHVERVSGDDRPGGQREYQVSLKLALIRIKERQGRRGFDMEPHDPRLDAHFPEFHRFPGLALWWEDDPGPEPGLAILGSGGGN